MYAQLCRRLVESAPNFEPPDEPCTFKKLLLKKCRYEFNNRAEIAKQYEAHVAQFAHGEGEAKYFSKKKMLGNLQFLGELCKVGIVHDAVLHKCCEKLLYHQERRKDLPGSEEDVECFCHLMKTCGRVLDVPKAKGMMDQYFERLQQLITPVRDAASGKEDYLLPLRIRCLVLDVIELRRQKWIPRRLATPGGKLVAKEERPKTIQQVREQAHRDGCIYLPQQQITDEAGASTSMTPTVKLVNPLLDNGPSFFERRSGMANGRKVSQGSKKQDHQNVGSVNSAGFLANFPTLSGSGPGTIDQEKTEENRKRFDRRGVTMPVVTKSNGFNGGINNGIGPSQSIMPATPPPDKRLNNNYEPAADFGDRFTGNRGHRNRFFNNNRFQEGEKNGFSTNHQTGGGYYRHDYNDYSERYRNGPPRGGNRYFKEYQDTEANQRMARPSLPSPPSIGSDQQHPPLMMSEEGFGGRVSSNLFQQQQDRNNVRSSNDAETNMLFKPRTLGVLPKSAIGPSGPPLNSQSDQRTAVVSKVMMTAPEPVIISKSEKGKRIVASNSNTTREEVFAKIDLLLSNEGTETVLKQWKDGPWLPTKMSQTAVNYLLKKIVTSSPAVREGMVKVLGKLVSDPAVSIHSTHCVEAVAKVWSELRKSEEQEDGNNFVDSCALLALENKLVALTDLRELLSEQMFLEVLQRIKPVMGEKELQKAVKGVKLFDHIESETDALQRLEGLGLAFLVNDLQIKRELRGLVKDKEALVKWIDANILEASPEFIVILVQVILEEVYGEGNDLQPETEKALLASYKSVLHPLLVGKEKQVLGVYAIQSFWQRRGFPKGALLKTFVHCYENDLIMEQAFLDWKEDLRDDFSGKGKALFQVNNWLTWLQEAESEDEDEDDAEVQIAIEEGQITDKSHNAMDGYIP